MSLVEVVIAMVLMSILMTTSAAVFIRGAGNGAGLQRRQAAVTLAQQSIEATRAVTTTPDAQGCVKLLQGRTKAVVDAQWAAAPGTVTSVTDEAWAPDGCGGSVIIPLQGLVGAVGAVTDPVVLGGQAYTVTTYIGTCALAWGQGGSTCGPDTGAPNTVPVYRVVVRVTWSGVGCTAQTCAYTASTLLDGSPDPVFNVRSAAAPVAAPDAVCLPSGGPGTIDVVANDSGSLGRTPVTIVSPPARGTLSPAIGSGIGGYTPNGGATGTDTFTYQLTDVNGVSSGTATVTITIGGCS